MVTDWSYARGGLRGRAGRAGRDRDVRPQRGMGRGPRHRRPIVHPPGGTRRSTSPRPVEPAQHRADVGVDLDAYVRSGSWPRHPTAPKCPSSSCDDATPTSTARRLCICTATARTRRPGPGLRQRLVALGALAARPRGGVRLRPSARRGRDGSPLVAQGHLRAKPNTLKTRPPSAIPRRRARRRHASSRAAFRPAGCCRAGCTRGAQSAAPASSRRCRSSTSWPRCRPVDAAHGPGVARVGKPAEPGDREFMTAYTPVEPAASPRPDRRCSSRARCTTPGCWCGSPRGGSHACVRATRARRRCRPRLARVHANRDLPLRDRRGSPRRARRPLLKAGVRGRDHDPSPSSAEPTNWPSVGRSVARPPAPPQSEDPVPQAHRPPSGSPRRSPAAGSPGHLLPGIHSQRDHHYRLRPIHRELRKWRSTAASHRPRLRLPGASGRL